MSKWVWLLAAAVACGGERAPAEEEAASAETPPATQTSVVTLRIDGMMCQGCAGAATEALEGIDGVIAAEVSFDQGTATVTCDPSKVDSKRLVAVLQTVEMGGERMPFQVSVVE